MIRSMTGYGSALVEIEKTPYLIEIRSVNGKTADVSLKTGLIPHCKEVETKAIIQKTLSRGSIDLFLTPQAQSEAGSDEIFNTSLMKQYLSQVASFQASLPVPVDATGLLGTLLHLPDVMESRKKEIPEDAWPILETGIKRALENIDAFRQKEGTRLAQELLSHVDMIEKLLEQVALQDPERIQNVRTRLYTRLKELGPDIRVDENRFEQELIYYLEKADITEEKVRLKQHCTYFRQTLDAEETPGRKLGFIAQEMGREINTLGSKATHAAMQQNVVRMKDELEKIKEQVLNVL